MTKILKYLHNTALNINDMFNGTYESEIQTVVQAEFPHMEEKISFGFASDKKALKSDMVNVGRDLKKGMEVARKEFSI